MFKKFITTRFSNYLGIQRKDPYFCPHRGGWRARRARNADAHEIWSAFSDHPTERQQDQRRKPICLQNSRGNPPSGAKKFLTATMIKAVAGYSECGTLVRETNRIALYRD